VTELIASRHFRKRLNKLGRKRQDTVAEALHRLSQNPHHPNSRLERLALSEGDDWSLRASRAKCFILFRVEEDIWPIFPLRNLRNPLPALG